MMYVWNFIPGYPKEMHYVLRVRDIQKIKMHMKSFFTVHQTDFTCCLFLIAYKICLFSKGAQKKKTPAPTPSATPSKKRDREPDQEPSTSGSAETDDSQSPTPAKKQRPMPSVSVQQPGQATVAPTPEPVAATVSASAGSQASTSTPMAMPTRIVKVSINECDVCLTFGRHFLSSFKSCIKSAKKCHAKYSLECI